MAKSIPSGVKIEYDNGADALQDISQYVQTINGVEIEQILEEVHTFGDSWEEHLPVGIGKVAQVTLGGLYDSAASPAPDALFGNRIPETPSTATRTLKITWVGSKQTSCETFLVKYSRKADRNALTQFEVTLQPTGAVTEA